METETAKAEAKARKAMGTEMAKAEAKAKPEAKVETSSTCKSR